MTPTTFAAFTTMMILMILIPVVWGMPTEVMMTIVVIML